jgi:hypothetical protein
MHSCIHVLHLTKSANSRCIVGEYGASRFLSCAHAYLCVYIHTCMYMYIYIYIYIYTYPVDHQDFSIHIAYGAIGTLLGAPLCPCVFTHTHTHIHTYTADHQDFSIHSAYGAIGMLLGGSRHWLGENPESHVAGIRRYVCVKICMCVYICIFVYVRVMWQGLDGMYVCVYMYICMCECVYICMCSLHACTFSRTWCLCLCVCE